MVKWSDIKYENEVKQKISPSFVQQHIASLVSKKSSKSWFISCPFHSEKDASLSIIVNEGYSQRVGFWRCFGCGRTGYWDELADVLKLPATDPFSIDIHENHIINIFSEKEDKKIKIASLKSWPTNKSWRSFSGKVINNFNGKTYPSKELPLILICKNRKGKILGTIKCRIKPKKKKPSYIFSKGVWISNYLWPEHSIPKSNIIKSKTIMLVEGVRDALAWILLGVTTFAILGTQSGFNETRLATLLGMGIENIILFMDNDLAGKNAVHGLYVKKELKKEGLHSILSKDFKVLVFPTWDKFPIEKSKMDPFKLSKNKSFVKKILKQIRNLK